MSKQGKVPDVPASGTSNEHLVLGTGDSGDSSRSIIEAEARLIHLLSGAGCPEE